MVTVAAYAVGERTCSAGSAECIRTMASWTTSSASLALPSIRYAIENM